MLLSLVRNLILPPPKRVGLALGAGAARGVAHIGVLDAIAELDIPIDYLAGTSAGALVGGVYASGRLEDLRQTLLQMEWREVLYYFLDLSFSKGGLIDGKRAAEFIGEHVRDGNVDDLPIPFRAVATDILTGAEVVLDEGKLIEVIRASIAVPGIFSPVIRGTAALVDGGLVNPVPVTVARDMGSEFIIAVDVNTGRFEPKAEDQQLPGRPVKRPEKADEEWTDRLLNAINRKWEELDQKVKAQMNRWARSDSGPNIIDVIGNAIRIMESQIAEATIQVTKPDIVIRPSVGHIHFMEFNRAEEAIEAGYRAAREALADARDRIGLPDRQGMATEDRAGR